MEPWQDIFGPVDWPRNVPAQNMTATYIPTEYDMRFDNANLIAKDNEEEQSSRIGFSHYYNSAYWRMTCDHFELKGESRLLVEMKAQTFIHKTDDTFCVALNLSLWG